MFFFLFLFKQTVIDLHYTKVIQQLLQECIKTRKQFDTAKFTILLNYQFVQRHYLGKCIMYKLSIFAKTLPGKMHDVLHKVVQWEMDVTKSTLSLIPSSVSISPIPLPSAFYAYLSLSIAMFWFRPAIVNNFIDNLPGKMFRVMDTWYLEEICIRIKLWHLPLPLRENIRWNYI